MYLVYQSIIIMAKTCSESHHPIFGYTGPISDNQLPTKLALYNHYRMIRTDCKNVEKSNVMASRQLR